MNSFDFVLLDVGGTLLGTNTDTEHWYEQFFVDACAEQGVRVSVPQVHEALGLASRTRTFEQRCSTPEQTFDFWHHIYSTAFRELIPACDADWMARHYIERFETGEFVQLFADTKETLDGIRSLKIPMGVVSNFGTYLTTFLEKTGISEYFEFLMISAVEGCEKPHPDIFDRAIDRTGVDPGRIMFVGDHPVEDYAAAERHGMFPVLIDRFGKHSKNLDIRKIGKLTELLPMLST